MTDSNPAPRGFPAQVVKLADYNGNKLVVNRGSIDGVKLGARFLVYMLSDEELTDPETGEPLGQLEIVRGRGVVSHVQERIATLEPEPVKASRRLIHRQNPFSILGALGGREEVIEEPEQRRGEFDDAHVGDRIKPI
jgi:hypothetical protein